MSPQVLSLGVLGAGQLAAMLATAANRLGVDAHLFRPVTSNDRCSADQITTAPFDDVEALRQFASQVDVVTVETEDIPVETLQILEELVPVRPSSAAIRICQDRVLEKQFLTDNQVPTARFGPVNSARELAEQVTHCGDEGILKTRRFGYDGKGQTRIRQTDDLAEAWTRHGESPSVLEELVDFDFEISVIAARSQSGDIALYDSGRNEHKEGILRTTEIPSRLAPGLEEQAFEIARRIVESLDYVGVMGIEFFVVGQKLLVNELAPRVHNSGHWTQQGCVVDQFEQHVRAVVGFPLGATERYCDVVMTNLIGTDVDHTSLFDDARGRLHLYGKREVRTGRKMGHFNAVQQPS